MLIIFGATIVSPKEVHHIDFTNDDATSGEDRLSTKHCQREFMKAMITNNSLIDAKALPLTSTHVLVFAHRQSGLSWFKPRASFKMPERGQHFTFEVQCGHARSDSITSQDDGRKVADDSVDMLSSENSLDSVESATASSSGNCSSILEEQETHMWFEAPVVIKGVKDTTTLKASHSDIWT